MTSSSTSSPASFLHSSYSRTSRSRDLLLIVSRRSPHFHRPYSQRPSPGPPAQLRQLIFSAVCRLHRRLPDQHQRAPGEEGLLFPWHLPPLLQSLRYICAHQRHLDLLFLVHPKCVCIFRKRSVSFFASSRNSVDMRQVRTDCVLSGTCHPIVWTEPSCLESLNVLFTELILLFDSVRFGCLLFLFLFSGQ